MPVIFSIVGKSDSGKTTLLEKLIPEIRKRGYRVGTIKHDVHDFDINHEGKDSWRHKHSGAQTVALSSPAKIAIVKDVEKELTLDEIVDNYLADMDIVLTEGYKREAKPKIEIFRKDGPHKEILCRDDKDLFAMVTDVKMQVHVPCFGLDEIVQLVDLIEKIYFSNKKNSLKDI